MDASIGWVRQRVSRWAPSVPDPGRLGACPGRKLTWRRAQAALEKLAHSPLTLREHVSVAHLLADAGLHVEFSEHIHGQPWAELDLQELIPSSKSTIEVGTTVVPCYSEAQEVAQRVSGGTTIWPRTA